MTKVADLVTKSDIARMLGVSRQRVEQLAREQQDFPGELGRVGRSIVWSRADIERWAKGWQRRSGRPPKKEANRAR